VIDFVSHEVAFDLAEQELVKDWLLLLVQKEQRVLAQLTYIFTSDEYVLGLNRAHLDHDYYTDTLTFPYHQKDDDPIISDIYISIERVQDNARTYQVSERDELHRVMAHGLLHLMGYDDHGDAEQHMRTKEEEALAIRTF
jgi:rRNA maturation RNase YbeY